MSKLWSRIRLEKIEKEAEEGEKERRVVKRKCATWAA